MLAEKNSSPSFLTRFWKIEWVTTRTRWPRICSSHPTEIQALISSMFIQQAESECGTLIISCGADVIRVLTSITHQHHYNIQQNAMLLKHVFDSLWRWRWLRLRCNVDNPWALCRYREGLKDGGCMWSRVKIYAKTAIFKENTVSESLEKTLIRYSKCIIITFEGCWRLLILFEYW